MSGKSLLRVIARAVIGWLFHTSVEGKPRRKKHLRCLLLFAMLFPLLPSPAFAAEETVPEDDLFELVWSILPQTWEGWMGTVIVICAILAAFLPVPPRNAHPAWKVCHRVISCLGLGAGRLRASGKIGRVGRLVTMSRRKP